MFEDKELLNTILYEKRYSTYVVCIIMILIGIGLCFIKVPDTKVTEAYNAKYPSVIWTDKQEFLDKISVTEKENKTSVTNNTNHKIIGLYLDNNYIKENIDENASVTIPQTGNLTGVAYIE